MSSLIPETRRPGVGTSLGNHEARLRALERSLEASGLGLRYDIDNVGDWLLVETTAFGPNGYGIDLEAPGQGVQIRTDDPGGGGDVYFNLGSPSDASDGSFVVDQASHFTVDAWASGTAISLVTHNVGGDIDIEAGDDINIQAADEITILAGGNMGLRVGSGKTFTVFNHLGVAKLQWTEGTADLHIPTGGTVIANL